MAVGRKISFLSNRSIFYFPAFWTAHPAAGREPANQSPLGAER